MNIDQAAGKTIEEANHRIANHLATLAALAVNESRRLQSGPDLIQRADAAAILDTLAAKIVAISSLHRRLSTIETDSGLDLTQMLQETLAQLARIYGPRLQVELNVDGTCVATHHQASVLAWPFPKSSPTP